MRLLPRPFIAALLASVLIASAGRAEQLFPGKYTGTVIFDRWDACILYSGLYFLYVSESQKEKLRPFAGQPVSIDATKIRQNSNPGDTCVEELECLGPPPASQYREKDKALKVRSRVFAGDAGKPVLAVTLENTGDQSIPISGDEIAPLILKRAWPDSKYYWGPIHHPLADRRPLSITLSSFLKSWPRPQYYKVADGDSLVVQSSNSLLSMQEQSHDRRMPRNEDWPDYWIDKEFFLPARFELLPGEKRTVEVQLYLPSGEYDLLTGYGDAFRTVATTSNLVAFDVKERGFVPVNVPGR